MRTNRPFNLTVLLTALLAGACQDGGPTEPGLDLLSTEEELTLALLQDPASVDVALELADIQESAAHGNGHGWGTQGNGAGQVRTMFHAAQTSLAQGDRVRAMERARQARRLVAQAIEGAGGAQAVEAMVERLESLPLEVASDPDAYMNSGKLGLQLGKLATTARTALRQGQVTRAGELGVLGEQAVRNQQRLQNRIQAGRAEIVVALGRESIELATRLLGDPISDTESQDLLAIARRFQGEAEEALEAGEEARAVHLARQAQWWALKAVVLPGGITDEEARAMSNLATTLLADARAAVGPELTELEEALLKRAARLLEMGQANLANGTCRGIGALWQSSVISSYLIGG
jgi:hypothetical protein